MLASFSGKMPALSVQMPSFSDVEMSSESNELPMPLFA